MTPQSDVQDPGILSPETSQTLFEMLMGFRVTQMIYVAAKLGIADLLKNGPKTVDVLAQTTSTHAPSLYRLLRALASLGIFAEDEQGRFVLTPLAELLQTAVPGSQRSRALYYGSPPEWRAWGELSYSVTTGKPAFQHLYGMDPWEYRAQNAELSEIFSDFMSDATTAQTAAVVAAYDFSQMGTIVDVGGGRGALISAILKANPQLQGILCDAPHVVADARSVLEAAGVANRCEIATCDFFSSVPGGGDAYILKYIIHDWDDNEAVAILKTCRRAMPEDGQLLLVENIIPSGNGPSPGKLLDLQMLVQLGGRERTEAEFRTLLRDAGFKLTKIVPTQAQLSIIEGIPE